MKRAPHDIVAVVAIDRRSRTPLYRQIYTGYREAILARRLRSGERLPSTRALARELGISRLPVLEAFDQLLAEGYCESRVGAGTFVARSLPALAAPQPGTGGPRPGRRPLARGPAARLHRPAPWLNARRPFGMGGTAVEHFPAEVWAQMVARHTRRPDRAALRYGNSMGHPPFREAIADYLRAARAVRCTAEQIMVVAGSQQALELTARVLIDPGDQVLVEDPGYWGARDVFGMARAKLRGVPVDAEGIEVASLPPASARLRAVYVTPSHQFPLGVTMSVSRRLQLLDWARRAGAWVIEDDYNSEYRYESQPVGALQGLDGDARVIYIGTFSKVLSPALRMGYLVLPEDLAPRFRLVRWAMDICPPILYQQALADFIAEGHFARHLRRTRELYRGRREILVDALRAELGGRLEILGEHAGMHVVVTLPPALRDIEISERAAAEGLSALHLSSCYVGRRPRQGLLLGYGGTDEDEIPDAVRRLRRVIEESERRAPRRRASAGDALAEA
jgi:GntR family transcriptional regulator/MocR family aminotransferase